MIHPIHKLGCQPAREDRRTLQLADYLDLSRLSLPEAVPVAFDWGQKRDENGDVRDLGYPMLLNDRLQICVPASVLHQEITWAGQTGKPFAPTDADAIAAYRQLAGYNPSAPCTDWGTSMLITAVRWRYSPIAGHKIAAFASVDRRREDLVAAAAWMFGGLWVGWNLPLAWQGADEWTTSPDGSAEGNWAPRSWGPHATHVPALSPQFINPVSWTRRIPSTWPAWHRYSAEAYVLWSQDMWSSLEGGRCPAGFDFEKLKHDLQRVTG